MLSILLLPYLLPFLLSPNNAAARRGHPERSPNPVTLDFQKLRAGLSTNLTRRNAVTSLGSLSNTSDSSSWTTTIQIGTPPVSFDVQLDTGSSDLWLQSQTCTGVGCVASDRYDPSASSTEIAEGLTFTDGYVSGMTMTADIYTDVVTMAGLTIQNQAFGSASSQSAALGAGVDGVLGIGASSRSQIYSAMQSGGKSGGDSLFVNLVGENPGIVDVIGVSVDADGGSICLGCIDGSEVQGDILWTPFTGGFVIAIDAMAVNGVEVPESSVSAYVDTGSTAIFAPPGDLGLIYDSVPGSALLPDGDGYMGYPCAAPPAIAFSIGGKWFNVSSELFSIMNSASDSDTTCVGGVLPVNLPPSSWILGDSFLQAVYAVFDFGNEQIGLAQKTS